MAGYSVDSRHHAGILRLAPGGRCCRRKRSNHHQLGATNTAAVRCLLWTETGRSATLCVVVCAAVRWSLRTLPARGRSDAPNSPVLPGWWRRCDDLDGSNWRHPGDTVECWPATGAGTRAVQLDWSGVGRSARQRRRVGIGRRTFPDVQVAPTQNQPRRTPRLPTTGIIGSANSRYLF